MNTADTDKKKARKKKIGVKKTPAAEGRTQGQAARQLADSTTEQQQPVSRNKKRRSILEDEERPQQPEDAAAEHQEPVRKKRRSKRTKQPADDAESPQAAAAAAANIAAAAASLLDKSARGGEREGGPQLKQPPPGSTACPADSHAIAALGPQQEEEIQVTNSKNNKRGLNRDENKWYSRLGELVEYKKVHGDFHVPPTYNEKLANWVNNQRVYKRYLDQGTHSSMTLQRVNAMEAIGFEWETGRAGKVSADTRQWYKRYGELFEYKKTKGDCNVPTRGYAPNPPLGSWVAKQREDKKFFDQGKKSAMTPQRIKLLEAIDFTWVRREMTTWEDRFKELEEYCQEFGDCNVPLNYEPNPSLGPWVREQRKHKKYLETDKYSHMTPQRMNALEGLGFDWGTSRIPMPQWDIRYKELVEYRRRVGNCIVPKRYSPNPALAGWVGWQRNHYLKLLKDGKSSVLTQDRVDRLNAIGFCWALRRKTKRLHSAVSDAPEHHEEETTTFSERGTVVESPKEQPVIKKRRTSASLPFAARLQKGDGDVQPRQKRKQPPPSPLETKRSSDLVETSVGGSSAPFLFPCC